MYGICCICRNFWLCEIGGLKIGVGAGFRLYFFCREMKKCDEGQVVAESPLVLVAVESAERLLPSVSFVIFQQERHIVQDTLAEVSFQSTAYEYMVN